MKAWPEKPVPPPFALPRPGSPAVGLPKSRLQIRGHIYLAAPQTLEPQPVHTCPQCQLSPTFFFLVFYLCWCFPC